MKRLNGLRWLRFLLVLAYFCLVVFSPEVSGQATLARLLFFGKTVFPSLFVSLCLSGMLVSSPPAGLLYRFPFGVEVTVFLLGMLCGFPIGARCATQLYADGLISKRRAEFLCAFTNLASLPFLTGVVGALFGDKRFGLRLAWMQALAALAAAGVVYLLLRPDCRGIVPTSAGRGAGVASFVATGAHTALELGGMLVFFGVAADSLTQLLGAHGVAEALLQGMLEFSSGCARAAALGGKSGEAVAVFSVGMSGLCVASQIASVTKGKLSLRPYLLGKLLQTVLMELLLLCV